MEDYVIIWEAKPLDKPEFRLYYDNDGKVLFYTCEKLEGNYIVIDAATYAESRPDLRVINGKLSTVPQHYIVSKLIPGNTGISCAKEDVSILVNNEYNGPVTKWKMTTYEL